MNDPAGRPGVQRPIRAFRQAIATGRGKPIEQMSPREARAVLEGLQQLRRGGNSTGNRLKR